MAAILVPGQPRARYRGRGLLGRGGKHDNILAAMRHQHRHTNLLQRHQGFVRIGAPSADRLTHRRGHQHVVGERDAELALVRLDLVAGIDERNRRVKLLGQR